MLRLALKKKSPVFLSLLLYFIMILVFPMLIGGYIFNEANSLFRSKSIDSARFVLKQGAVTFDRFFEVSDDAAYSFAIDPAILSAANRRQPSFASRDIIHFTSLLNRILSNDISSPFQNNTILFLKQPNAVVRRENVSFGIEQFYMNNMRYDDMTFEEWEEAILNQSHNRHFLSSRNVFLSENRDENFSREYISYIHSFPLMTSVVLIDSYSARMVLSETIISDSGAALVLDANREMILSTGDENTLSAVDLSLLEPGSDNFYQNINGVEMIILSIRSANNGLQYISINPVNDALRDVVNLQRQTIVSVFIILVLGFFLSLVLSRHYTKPIQEIISLLGKRFTEKDSQTGNTFPENASAGNYQMIKERVTELITSHNELSKAMQDQMIVSRALFFGQLLSGTIRDQQELDRFIAYFSLCMDGNYYTVLHLMYKQSKAFDELEMGDILEQDIFKLAIDEVLQTASSYNGYSYNLENKDVAIILCLNAKNEDELNMQLDKMIAEIQKILMDKYNISPVIGVGSTYRKLLDVNFAYVEAGIVMDHILQESEGAMVLRYSDLGSQEKCGYYYPLDIEQRLRSLARMGKKDELLRNLHQIYRENFTNRSLARNIQIQLFFEMRTTVTRIVNELKYMIDIDSLLHMDFAAIPQYDILQKFTSTYVDICDAVNIKKKSHNQKLIANILEEIEKEFTDPGMSVEHLASRFNITSTYFSRFFKEQTNEVFSNYLENMRMKKACELLDNTDLSVDKIASEVGYNSAYSFRRAFKKNLGVVPTEYRK